MRSSITKSKIYIILLLLLLLFGCSKTKEEDYVAKVGNSLLTESMINDALQGEAKHKYRNEFIRKWIEKELFYLSAVNNGILESEEFKKLSAESEKEIANALLMKKKFSTSDTTISEKDLENFFVQNVSEFKVATDKYKYNIVSFNNKFKAQKFRRMLISSSWERTLEKFSGDKTLVLAKENLLESSYTIFPITIKRELNKLTPNSFSKLFESQNGIYTVVLLKKLYRKNDIPEFADIKDDVKNKYISYKRDIIYNEYLKNLYKEYSIEIENKSK